MRVSQKKTKSLFDVDVFLDGKQNGRYSELASFSKRLGSLRFPHTRKGLVVGCGCFGPRVDKGMADASSRAAWKTTTKRAPKRGRVGDFTCAGRIFCRRVSRRQG